MGRAARIEDSVGHIVRLRRVERIPAASEDVASVRRHLESEVGPTLSRATTARLLGVSQTALDRWIAAGAVPTVMTPTGRVEVPRQFAVELLERIEELRGEGRTRHLLATALRRRREAAQRVDAAIADLATRDKGASHRVPHGHQTAERRSLAYHRVIAERLDDRLVDEARRRIDRLADRGSIHPHYVQRWREVLSRPIPEIAEAITAETEEARDLRQNSPFAGVLNEQERLRIIEQVV